VTAVSLLLKLSERSGLELFILNYPKIIPIYLSSEHTHREGGVIECKFGDPKYNDVIESEYRTQLLHHCATFMNEWCMFVKSEAGRIWFVVLVHHPKQLLQNYLEILDNIRQTETPFIAKTFNRDQPCPKVATGVDFGWAVDQQTVELNFHLHQALMHKVISSGKPLPKCKIIKPALVQYWNKMKGIVKLAMSVHISNVPLHIHVNIIIK